MRLRARIVIDIDANDFADAATHQQQVEQIYELARTHYGQAQLEFRQRRSRANRASTGYGPKHFTGRMSEYEE